MAYPSITYTFTNGTTADGANVSTNFSNLVSGLSDGTKDLNMNAATFAGNLTANGNIVLGNATSDTVILTGIVSLATAGSYISNLLGSALLPTYSFTGDVNTGIWSSGADTLNFSTGGTERVRIDSSGFVGIGATTGALSFPTVPLHISNGTSSITLDRFGSAPALIGRTTGGTIGTPSKTTSGLTTFSVVGRGWQDTTGAFTTTNSSIISFAASEDWTSTAQGGIITFGTATTGTTSTTERVRIDGSGNVGIGTTAATDTTAGRTYLSIKGTSAGQPGVVQLINFTGNGDGQNLGNVEWVNPDNTSSSSLRSASIAAITSGSTANNRGSYMLFATKTDGVSGGGTERLRIENTGRIFASSAIQRALGSTPDSTSTTTCYIEAGTFTSTITNGANVTSTGTLTMHWTRVGNIVTCGFQCSSIIATSGTSVQTQFAFTLPITASYTAATNLNGTGAVDPGGTGTKQVAVIYGISSSGLKAQFDYLAVNTTNSGLYGTFTYLVQ